MVISFYSWKGGLEEKGEKETDIKDGIQLQKQGSDCYGNILEHSLHFHGAHSYIAKTTGDPLHPRALMANLDTVFSLTLCYGQKKNIADKQGPKLSIGLTKVLADLHWEESVCVAFVYVGCPTVAYHRPHSSPAEVW